MQLLATEIIPYQRINLSYGGVWLEDITWIEPITECADTNLTFEISVAQGATNISNVSAAAEAKLNVSFDDWNTMQTLCGGNASIQQPNVSNVGIMCGYLYGAPDPITHPGSQIFQPYSKYKQSLYVCASGVRASIKQVRFSTSGSTALDNLRVTSVEDKSYENNASRPLWAVERTYRPVTDAKPLWGMVDDRYETAQDLSTLPTDKFWLPATTTDSGYTEGLNIDSLASTAVLFGAMMTTYRGATKGSGIQTVGGDLSNLLDYSGSNNAALNRLWWIFSRSPSTANKIINLIFTEVLVTATVGTKSAIISSNGAESSSIVKVVQYTRKLQYDLLYAIPVFVILLICLLVTAGVILCLIARFSLKKMSQLLNQTSTGRVLTTLLYPDISKVDATTSQWLLAAGDTQIQYPFRRRTNLGETDSSNDQDDTSELSDNRSRDAEEMTEAANEQMQMQNVQPDGSRLPVQTRTQNLST